MIRMARPSLSGSGATDNRTFKLSQSRWDAFKEESQRREGKDASTKIRELIALYMGEDVQDGAR
jgi:hypothetical protein